MVRIFCFPFFSFGQNANCARDINKCIIGCGDIDGRWSLIPLLFGEFPQGVQNYPSATLITAQQKLFPNDIPGHISVPQDIAEPCLCCNLKETQEKDSLTEANCEDVATTCYESTGNEAIAGLGFLNFPVRYRKRGLRAEFDFQITKGLGIMLQTGFADICQSGAFQNVKQVLRAVLLEMSQKKTSRVIWYANINRSRKIYVMIYAVSMKLASKISGQQHGGDAHFLLTKTVMDGQNFWQFLLLNSALKLPAAKKNVRIKFSAFLLETMVTIP
jgi:hypothetical protein